MTRHGDRVPPRFWTFVARVLLRGREADRVRDELTESFLRDLARGLPRAKAARRYAANVLGSAWSLGRAGAARLRTGGVGLDARLGLRMLTKQPLLTGVAVMALGLGIPAALIPHHAIGAIFGPLPVQDGARVLGIREYDPARSEPMMATLDDYQRWRAVLRSYSSMGAARSYKANLSSGDPGAAPVLTAQITASSFALLRSSPLLGRVLDAADEVRGAQDVVLIGEDLWRSRFAGDPGVVGRSVRVGRTLHTVVGVMPAGFRYPLANEVWLPLRAHPADDPADEARRLYVYGRLADGVTPDQADLEMELVTERAAAVAPAGYEHRVGEVVPMGVLLLQEDGLAKRGVMILLIEAACLALLLLVCGNVGTLILAKTATRTQEIAIRTAMGASRMRIVVQIFVETLMLALVATGCGLALAEVGARWLTRLLLPFGELPWWADLTLTPDAVLAALGLAALSAVVAGVVPAIKATRADVQENLQSAASGKATLRFGWGSGLLIVSEVVLSVGFMALGGTVLWSASQDRGASLGFDPQRYVAATVTIPGTSPGDGAPMMDSADAALRIVETQRRLLARLAEDPEVAGVGMALSAPGISGSNRGVVLETPPAGFQPPEWDPGVERVDVGYFRGLHRPILAGRDFAAEDVRGGRGTRHTAVIVNESFVRDMLGGRNAVGQRFRYEDYAWDEDRPKEWYEIVGVVGAFGANPLNPMRDAAVYHPLAPGEANPIRFVVEVAGDANAFLPRFRELSFAVDDEAIAQPRLLSEQIEAQSVLLRAVFLLELTLAGLAFLLSVAGLYALMSFTVSQRTREIGIRVALGAGRGDIIGTVVRRAAIQLGIGLALGAPWAWVLLHSQRNDRQIAPANIPLTIAATLACAALVGLIACAAPTLRGLRIQPNDALRES